MIILVTGGSGCGKSTWAEKLIVSLPQKERLYIATMRVCDAECERRVARHRAMRADKGFVTAECEKDLASVDVPAHATVLLEDLVNLVANEMFFGGDVNRVPDALARLAERADNLVIVTNDVFSDGIRYDPDTEAYRQVLADINAFAASLADTVVEVIYSIPVAVKGELPCI